MLLFTFTYLFFIYILFIFIVVKSSYFSLFILFIYLYHVIFFCLFWERAYEDLSRQFTILGVKSIKYTEFNEINSYLSILSFLTKGSKKNTRQALLLTGCRRYWLLNPNFLHGCKNNEENLYLSIRSPGR